MSVRWGSLGSIGLPRQGSLQSIGLPRQGSLQSLGLRWINAVSLLLSLALLAWPIQTAAQQSFAQNPAQPPAPASNASASNAPVSDDGAPSITVQIAPPPISSSMLGLSSPLGAQSAIGKPIYAEFITEHHQNFSDGNRISRSTFSSIYRDTQGRLRRESQLSLPGLSAGISTSTFITIVDHQLGCGFVLDPQEMVAHRYELNAGPSYVARLRAQAVGPLLPPDFKQPAAAAASSATPAAAASQWHPHAFSAHRVHPATDGSPTADDSASATALGMRIDQPFLAAPNPVRTEDLGDQVILGFRAHGTRVITTLPAGQIGNDRPIDIVSEQWFSPELELVMRSVHRDPWAGEFTTTVTQIVRGDQPSVLFEVPPTYKVIDAASEGEHHVLGSHSDPAPR